MSGLKSAGNGPSKSPQKSTRTSRGSIGKASKPLESARTASEKHVFEKYPAESYQKRATEIIRSLRNEVPHYEQYSDRTLLNLSFRCGDELHCQWTANEEAHMYPFLVHTGAKPVATLVVQNLVDPWVRKHCTEKDAEILCDQIRQLCDVHRWHRVRTKVVLNPWGVLVVVFFQRSSNESDITNGVGSISDSDLDGVLNETLSREDMGKFYGYNDDIYAVAAAAADDDDDDDDAGDDGTAAAAADDDDTLLKNM